MMSARLIFTVSIVCVLSIQSTALTEEVDVEGVVATAAMKPIEGAFVSGINFTLRDTSDAEGRFRLTGNVMVTGVSSPFSAQPSMNSGTVKLSGNGPLLISVTDINGKIVRKRNLPHVENFDYRSAAGISLYDLPPGAYIITLKTAGAVIATRLVANGRTCSFTSTGSLHTASPEAAKTGAALTGYIEVRAPGYITKTVALSSWKGSVGTIVLDAAATFTPGDGGLDVSDANRLGTAVQGVNDFSQVGIEEGKGIPAVSASATKVDVTSYGVVPNDGKDDSEALQKAINSLLGRSNVDPRNPAVIQLPSGRIDLDREIKITVDHVVILGRGNDPGDPNATLVVLRPNATMRYDRIDADGVPDIDNMSHSGNTMGWIWPGRGTFRVQATGVHEDYTKEYAGAPANRKDIYEGSINFHWTNGLNVDQSTTYPARVGDRVIKLDQSASRQQIASMKPGSYVWVGAANSEKMYREQGVPEEFWERLHMKIQIFKLTAVDQDARTITLDTPLEFDLPANSASDGSKPIGGSKPYPSRVTPLTVVTGVGFENFYLTLDLQGLPNRKGGSYSYTAQQAQFNYGNMAPEYAMHGLVFKWAVDCWVRGVHTFMTGSHPFVTEQVSNLQVENCLFDGSWNKGGGGNGYVRLSRAWNCLISNNILRNLRHLTLQWSSSGNVVIGNDMDCEINLHGGWERYNLAEMNRIRIPFKHAHTNCTIGCDHLDGVGANETWYPIYWSTGAKAGKWSGSSGPRNIFFNNIMKKQVTPGGPYEDYKPYYNSDGSSQGVIFQFGWDRETPAGSHWVHLEKNGTQLDDWAGNERVDYSSAPNLGVNAQMRYEGTSLFLKKSPQPIDPD